ncbi:glycosyltransferase family 4 protein [Flavobacterium phragmitis]|uniref:Glycosyltransferase involved in cell wall bisynthesis n=1 Tax=Flavobacterium phragmitis TaxID=739143 RepID=A0A1I1UP84_9FLAO|nr:glycosyltransferase family 4 protein [Flavobacterium phragmitis]SFD72606.1 Glycosyltransferase involved in cell wall bisynthesis [Flavobacterium phragmitis]
MDDLIKVILISQSPLPYSSMGSWTTLYNNYLEKDHKIDYIICPEPEKKNNSIKYNFADITFFQKLRSRVFNKKRLEYLNALQKIISPEKKYIIQIVDNSGMVKPLHDYLISKRIRDNCYIQFFYHGFSPYTKMNSKTQFYELVNEIVVLTHDSYKEHKRKINVLPCHFSVLYNGVDTTKFKKIADLDRQRLRQKFGFENKKVFVWCSQDRPKKGLHIILEAWKKIYEYRQDILLVIIGSDKIEDREGVNFLGRIPNNDLPQYLQASDCYLFPTLWQEGFGLSLIEALHCGNYCIASASGGVPEVLQYGKLGRLIESPHFVSEWVEAMNDFLEKKFEVLEIKDDLYSIESWKNGMNEIIEEAKFRLQKNKE